MPEKHGYQQSTAAWAKRAAASIAAAKGAPFWTDDAAQPEPQPPLSRAISTDLLIVGGGYAGLWTALQAKERDPDRDVVLLEATTLGAGASGRNGGFVEASLTHGDLNGELHFAADLPVLKKLGIRNLRGMQDTLLRYGLNADFESCGALVVATEPHQADELLAAGDQPADSGDLELFRLDQAEVRAQLDSPLFLAGLYTKGDVATVHPGKLVWALRSACLTLGVQIFENSPAAELSSERPSSGGSSTDGWSNGSRSGGGGSVRVKTPSGSVSAQHVVLATNAFPSLLRRVNHYLVPVYDYVLMTEPLTAEQLRSIGWSNRQGLSDMANQFHYYRLTADNRILWGGYDAIYHFGRRVRPEYENRPETFQKLAEQFFLTFPQLADVNFSHKWGGAIDTCSRFAPFFGTAHGGRVAYVAGFTGLGVGSTRWAGQVLLDLLSGVATELTELAMVRNRPIPFPPEPLTWPLVEVTRRSLNRADANRGKRNLLLRSMDRMGVGFGS